MLKIRKLCVYRGAKPVLRGADLEVEEGGEIVALCGRDGAGKTTMFSAIMGLIPPCSGSILFKGREIVSWLPFRIARLGLGFVPEGRRTFPNLTVEENLTVAIRRNGSRSFLWTIQNVFDLFPALGRRRNAPAVLLSGGEQQMLALGRALMGNPDMLLIDEAMEGLAPLIRREIRACLVHLKEGGTSVLAAGGDASNLGQIADKRYALEGGRTVGLNKTPSTNRLRARKL